MSLLTHAVSELDRLGLKEGDDIDGMMRKHILHMVNEFADEGHSGFSASYAISCLKRLLEFKPLTPLTGEDSEWNNVSEYGHDGTVLYQNKRFSSVFKDENGAYNIDGKVLWNWYKDEDGAPYKSYYTSKDSRVPVTFPYEVPERPEYVYEYPDDPNAPTQNEDGLLESDE